jgi:protoporphyrinogen IX oxidase
MTFFYIKALHIVFVVTWFSGMFYLVRLLIYNREAQDRPEPERSILQGQLNLMIRRLLYGITWPSAILTLVFGGWMWYLYPGTPDWLWLKVGFVTGLYAYHITLHYLCGQQFRNEFGYTSMQLRVWNEVATIFLLAIVFLAVLKNTLSWVYGLIGLAVFTLALLAAIRVYKSYRS